MKKSVVILIAIIYIASIALVSFFGLKFKVFEAVVYVQEIEILNEDLESVESLKALPGFEDMEFEFDYYVIIQPDEHGERKYQIEYRVHPDDATNQKANFVYDQQTTEQEGITVDQDSGLITFSAPGAIIVQLLPDDQSDVTSPRICIFAE